jgi:hypothetical protein
MMFEDANIPLPCSPTLPLRGQNEGWTDSGVQKGSMPPVFFLQNCRGLIVGHFA